MLSQPISFNETAAGFTYSLIIVGATEKELQFIIPIDSIDGKNFGFMEQKCIFENCTKVKTIKKYVN